MYITGKTEHIPGVSPDIAAQEFRALAKIFKGKIPITLGSLFMSEMFYNALLKQADSLGVKTKYNKNTDFGNSTYSVAKNRLRACNDLTNQIMKQLNKK